jgi:hypothetical protein
MGLSRDGYRRTCLQRFRYLVTEFGFAVVPRETGKVADPFRVSYLKGELVVAVRGSGYGSSVYVTLGWGQDRSWGKEREVGLGHLLALRDPDNTHQPWEARSQSGQLRAYAAALRACAEDVLTGDLSFLPDVWEHQMRLHREYRKEESRKYRNYRRRLRRAERKADEGPS